VHSQDVFRKVDPMNRRRITLTLGAAVGGLLAAAFLPATVAVADINELVTPDTSTFDPTPTAGFFEYATGTEDWNSIYLPDPSGPLGDVPDAFTTNDTFEKFGSIVNDYATVTGFTVGPSPEVGSAIDFLQFGGGFGNEFVFEPGAATSITDLLITPFGDVTLLG
jgi:hypothetical protein